jgi:hypothetical protein
MIAGLVRFADRQASMLICSVMKHPPMHRWLAWRCTPASRWRQRPAATTPCCCGRRSRSRVGTRPPRRGTARPSGRTEVGASLAIELKGCGCGACPTAAVPGQAACYASSCRGTCLLELHVFSQNTLTDTTRCLCVHGEAVGAVPSRDARMSDRHPLDPPAKRLSVQQPSQAA